MSTLHVGYVLKRFPRASETFIAQEIRELERQGAKVTVFGLRPSDTGALHGWLSEIQATVLTYPHGSFSNTWKAIKRASEHRPERRSGARQAVLAAFDHPFRSGRRYLSEAAWIARQVRELGVDHLHAHFANHPAFTAMLAHLVCGVPYSFTAHAKDIYANGPTPELWRQQVRHAAFAVTVSEANRRHLEPVLGPELALKLRRLYNGVDLERIGLTEPAATAANGAHRLLFVSRLIEKKGADVLLEALALLQRGGERPEAVLVGDGPQAEALRRQVDDFGLDGQVRFTGLLPQEEVLALMRRSDLFVLPCRVAADGDRDALPTVLLEAMATGLPCVSTPVNGVPEIVDDGASGLLVPEDDPPALAEAIADLLADPERRRRMARVSRARVPRLFDARKNVETLHEWLRDSAARHRSGPEESVETVSAWGI